MSTLLQAGVVDSISVANSPKSNYIYATYDSPGSAPGLHNIKILDGNVISDVPSLKSSVLNQPTQRTISARIESTVSQSFSDATVTDIEFNTIIYDTDNMVDLNNNRLVVRTPGVYALFSAMRGNFGPGNRVQVRVQINNNSVVLNDTTAVAGTAGYNSSTHYLLDEGDLITATFYQNSTGSRSSDPGLGAPSLGATLVSTDFIDPIVQGTPLLCIRSKTTPLTIVDVLAGSTVESS